MTSLITLGFSQEYIYHQQRMRGFDSWPIRFAHNIRGNLDVTALEASLDALVERHEALRLRIISTASGPRQFVETARNQRDILKLRELAGLGDRPLGQAVAYLARLGERDWALERDPVFGFTLVRLSESHHVLIGAFQQVAMDGHSLALVEKELWQRYRGGTVASGPDSDLAAASFTEVVAMQRRRFEKRKARSNRYWATKSFLNPTTMQIREGGESAGAPDPEGTRSFDLSGSALAGLRNACRDLGTSALSWVLSALALTVFEFTTQENMVIRVALDSRGVDETTVVGRLASYFPVQIDRSGESPAYLLGRVNKNLFNTMLNQCADAEARLTAERNTQEGGTTPAGSTISLDYRKLEDFDNKLYGGREINLERMNDVFLAAPPHGIRLLVRERSDVMGIVLLHDSRLSSINSERFTDRLRTYLLSSSDTMEKAVPAHPSQRFRSG